MVDGGGGLEPQYGNVRWVQHVLEENAGTKDVAIPMAVASTAPNNFISSRTTADGI